MSFAGHQNPVVLPVYLTGTAVLLLWTDILDNQQSKK